MIHHRLSAAIVSLAFGLNSSLAHPHHDPDAAAAVVYAAAPITTPPPPALVGTNAPVVSGTGQFRYQYQPDKLVLPPEVRMKHGHGLCRDADGTIYFTFEPQRVEADTRCLVRFAPDGTGARLLGSDSTLAQGAPHGLNLHRDSHGQAHLYHANNNATVHKTTLDGTIEWTRQWPPYMGKYKPTDVVVPPGGDRVFVADGYGSSMIHALKDADGVYAGKSWGGLGAAHTELNCPHGITFDPRTGLLLVADRGNKRLEYFTTNGLYHSTIQVDACQAPCNADVWGDFVLIPDLNGPLVILDRENKVISVIEVGKLLGPLGFKHPHDAIWLANGDIAVCTWNPGRLGYWKRLP